ncbi:hypothetical protein M885DRAFT_554399 [Pelagophyceae sp. CCMP2097]|nr:hypothetical protein M885DRAFT_554399 [Pelagophyceae sp. CCMP2097]
MRPHALGYLRIAALGAPTATLWLVVNGIFRGLGDTKTPLVWALLFTLMNALFDPILIFPLGLGAAGAAAGTAIAQTLALYPLLRALSKKVGASGNSDVPALFACASRQSLQDSLKKYANAGGFVLLRTLGKIAAYSICAREASKLGAVAAAAHNVCFQLGVATTQLCESAAVAIQALLAREAKLRVSPDRATADAAMMRARYVVGRGVLVGGVISTSVSGFTYLTKESVVFALTTDAAVRAAALSIMPAVLLCQALKGLAYPINGALMGNLDWSFASVTMWLAQAGCAAVLLSGPVSLSRLWASFVALFAIQCGAGALRIVSDTGPWRNFLGWPKAD